LTHTVDRNTQYTPPTPTRRNCRVESHRRCEQNSQLAHDDCRRVRSHRRHGATRLRCWQICSDSSRLSPTSCEFRTHRRRDSTRQSRRRRRCVLDLTYHSLYAQMCDELKQLLSSARSYCDQAGLFVCWLVRSFVTLVMISQKTASPIFMKFDTVVQHLRQISPLTFQRSRSKFKVKTAVLKIFHLQ